MPGESLEKRTNLFPERGTEEWSRILNADIPVRLTSEEVDAMINHESERARVFLTPLPTSDITTRIVYGIKRFLNGFRRFWVNLRNTPRRPKFFESEEMYYKWRKSIELYPRPFQYYIH